MSRGRSDCTTATLAREWTEEEISLFGEIGRYATLALNNTLLHDRAVREMAKVNAILDQIPESAAIYDAPGEAGADERRRAARAALCSSRPIPTAACATIGTATSTAARWPPKSCRRCARCTARR